MNCLSYLYLGALCVPHTVSGMCEPMPTEESCLSIPSKLYSGTSMCEWTAGKKGAPGSCALAPPGVGFIMCAILTFVDIVFQVFAHFIFRFKLHFLN